MVEQHRAEVAEARSDGGGADPGGRDQRRRRVIEAAADLMAEVGFHRASMHAIAEAADSSVGALYQHVTSKEELLLVVMLDRMEEHRNAVQRAVESIDDPVDRLAAMFRAVCRSIDERPDLLLLSYRESGTLGGAGREQVKDIEREMLAPLVAAVESGVGAGLLEVPHPVVAAYALLMAAHTWALKRWNLKQLFTLDDYCDAQLAVFLGGALRPEHRDAYPRHLPPGGGGGGRTGPSSDGVQAPSAAVVASDHRREGRYLHRRWTVAAPRRITLDVGAREPVSAAVDGEGLAGDGLLVEAVPALVERWGILVTGGRLVPSTAGGVAAAVAFVVFNLGTEPVAIEEGDELATVFVT